ncbi:MAG: class A beta-lactamase-related serine hydrolase [Nocardiopsaceae bacterium]|nr:class A beta-lactamase-related serine hydrolase [Nocardiopsaceae bacterium]
MRVEAFLRELREVLDDAGLRGSFLVRDLHTGDEIGIEPDLEFPTASLVKVPLAIATLDRIRRGELDGAAEVQVRPEHNTALGPTGLSRFRRPARIAIDDLVYLSMSVSDNTAADLLFALTPPGDVANTLRELGVGGITVRSTIRNLSETPQEQLAPADAHLAHTLAIEAGTAGRGHSVPQLDVTRASSGTARAYVELLQALWLPSAIAPEVAERIRDLMAANLLRQRLAPDFSSDASQWSSKTGTLLNLRHEIGVVEHADGQLFAVAALTESRVPAIVQPEAEAVMGRVARRLRDHLRENA